MNERTKNWLKSIKIEAKKLKRKKLEQNEENKQQV